MSVDSNAHTVRIVAAGTSDLAVLAQGMSSGQMSSFTMGGLSSTLMDAGGGHSIMEYCQRGHWDPVHKLVQFWGQGHNSETGLATWDDATNQWSVVNGVPYSNPATSTGHIGHQFTHQALDPATGDIYLRDYGGLTIYKKPYGSAWTTAASLNSTSEFLQVASALEWFPQANSGAGGLVFVNVGNGSSEIGSTQISNAAVSSWGSPVDAPTSMSAYCNWIAASNSVLYFGGSNTNAYSMAANGSMTTIAATQLSAGAGVPWTGSGENRSPVVAGPDGASLFQFEYATNGNIYKFNGTSWSNVGSHSLVGGVGTAGWFLVSIPDYGVILCVQQNSASVGTVTAKVYKA